MTVEHFTSPEECRDSYGPTVAVYFAVAAEPDRRAELDAALIALADLHLERGLMRWEYLLVSAEVV